MRLIDADALKEEFTCKGDEWINNIIDNEPTIDAVSVVRCGECKHNEYCCRHISADGRKPDDFCSYGEREGE